jgi:CO dehydrogenase/acetyl-CoA synthase delta subunit
MVSCANLVTILAGNRPILADTGAPASGCNSLNMLIDAVKCELALGGSTGLRTKRSHVRVVPGA